MEFLYIIYAAAKDPALELKLSAGAGPEGNPFSAAKQQHSSDLLEVYESGVSKSLKRCCVEILRLFQPFVSSHPPKASLQLHTISLQCTEYIDSVITPSHQNFAAFLVRALFVSAVNFGPNDTNSKRELFLDDIRSNILDPGLASVLAGCLAVWGIQGGTECEDGRQLLVGHAKSVLQTSADDIRDLGVPQEAMDLVTATALSDLIMSCTDALPAQVTTWYKQALSLREREKAFRIVPHAAHIRAVHCATTQPGPAWQDALQVAADATAGGAQLPKLVYAELLVMLVSRRVKVPAELRLRAK